MQNPGMYCRRKQYCNREIGLSTTVPFLRYTGGPGGLPQIPKNRENPPETIFWLGLGGNRLAQTPPGYHTIHLGHGKSHNPKFRTHSHTTPCFSGPHFGSKNLPKPPQASPGQIWKSWVQILVPGSKNGSPGPKTKNMRTEKPCRTPVSDLKIWSKLWPETILGQTRPSRGKQVDFVL